MASNHNPKILMFGRINCLLLLLQFACFSLLSVSVDCPNAGIFHGNATSNSNGFPKIDTSKAKLDTFCKLNHLDLVYLSLFSGTNPDFTFIFYEPTPLLFFTAEKCMYGLGSDRLMHTKPISTLVYSLIVGLYHIMRLLNLFILKHTPKYWSRDSLIICSICKRRKYVAAVRYHIHLSSVAAVVLLLLLCGDVHPNPGPVLPGSTRHPNAQHLVVGSWNVRTLLESKRNIGRPSAIVARELNKYGVDIAALSETRVLDSSVFEETGSGYTFFLKGKPIGEKHYHGVGFAIRTKLVKHLKGVFPVGISERLMTMSFPLEGSTLSIISAPTLNQSDEEKDNFYGAIRDAIDRVPYSNKLLVMGDFNARVGCDYDSWENVIGKHGVGNVNSNGTRLLSMCAHHDLIASRLPGCILVQSSGI